MFSSHPLTHTSSTKNGTTSVELLAAGAVVFIPKHFGTKWHGTQGLAQLQLQLRNFRET